MILKQVLVFNYQSLQDVYLNMEANFPTIFVGINDSGKSVILKAIGLLLTLTPQFAFQRDASAKRDLSNKVATKESLADAFTNNGLPLLDYSEEQAIIAGKFVLEPSDFSEDVTGGLSNELLWTIESSTDSTLWLAKVFNNVAGSSEVYLFSQDGDSSNEGLRELWSKGSKELTALRKKESITDEEVTNLNKTGRFKNIEQIRALYSHAKLEKKWCKYSEYKKDIGYFPQYRYLGWEFSLEDLKKIATDAMKGIIDQHTSNVRKVAGTEADIAEKEVNDALEAYASLLKEDVPTLTGLKTNLIFDVKPAVSDVLVNKINADGDIHLDSQGEGVKRQIWFALIRIAAVKASATPGPSRHQFFWCFDEPETHLYPAAQRKFFDALATLASTTIQVALSTHSTIFTDRASLHSIKNVTLEQGYTSVGTCSSTDDVLDALQAKNSDFLFYDKFLIVEGDTESELMPHLYRLLKDRSLDSNGIQLVNLGGKDKRAESITAIRNIFKGFRKPDQCIVLLLDGDAKHEALPTNGLTVHYVGKQDIEDSISSNVWMELLRKVDLDSLISKERLEEIKSEIPGTPVQSNQKFFSRLKAEIINTTGQDGASQRVIDNYPQKGKQLGHLLEECITTPSEIPSEIASMLNTL